MEGRPTGEERSPADERSKATCPWTKNSQNCSDSSEIRRRFDTMAQGPAMKTGNLSNNEKIGYSGDYSFQHRRRASADNSIGTSAVHDSVQQNTTVKEKKIDQKKTQSDSDKKSMWDCDSSLYDSFELFTFSQQLNRAMATLNSTVDSHQSLGLRSTSMPHYVSAGPKSLVQVQRPTNGHERADQAICDHAGRQETVNWTNHNGHEINPTVGNGGSEPKREIGHSGKMRQRLSRSVQRLFRVFNKKSGNEKKVKNGVEVSQMEEDEYYVVYPDQHHQQRYLYDPRLLGVETSDNKDFDAKVRKIGSERISHEKIRRLSTEAVISY
eukprot:Gb_36748 [translate_table: standard]